MSNIDIKKIRKNLGLTQEEFAKRLYVSFRTIQNWEKGETIPVSKHAILSELMNETKKIVDKPQLISQGIPMLPFDAFAGVGDSTVAAVNFDVIEERYIVPLFDGLKVDFMIPVRGSSMYPKYSSGDVVACRIISDLLFVQWNKVYVIDSISQGIIMKRLLKSENIEHVICRSDNKDYGDFAVPNNDIRAIALVVGVIRLE